MDKKFSRIYYSTNGLYRGYSAVDKLADATKSTKEDAKKWLERQVFYQIYLPAPKKIVRRSYNETEPNAIHQADLLFLPYDKYKRKTYKYALTVIDVASRLKEAEPLTTKNSDEVAAAFERIYKRSKLKFPKLLQVDSGTEFKGAVSKLFEKHGTQIRRGHPNIHREQCFVESFNRRLAEQIFGKQYAKEILLAARNDTEIDRVREWVKDLPLYIAKMNDTVTRMIKMKPNVAVELNIVTQPEVEKNEVQLELKPDSKVRYLYEPGELEGGVRRATDPNWSLTMHDIARIITGKGPTLYYIHNGPKRSFVREELMVVPSDSSLPPDNIL